MAETYVLTTNIGKVRLTTGDNVMTAVVFSDEEIQIFLDAQGDSIPLASADLLEAWAAKYGQSAASETIGDYAYTQKIIANMLALAKRLRETDASKPYFKIAEMDLAAIGEE